MLCKFVYFRCQLNIKSYFLLCGDLNPDLRETEVQLTSELAPPAGHRWVFITVS